MGGSAVVGAEAFRRGSGFATGARPWLRSSSPLLSKRHTRWRVRSDANSAEVTRYVDQCVPVKLEKVPMELLILLLEKDGHLVTRQQIIERLWGNDVFVDTEHGINTAIRKIRQALKDDPDQPRFVQTVTGKGYRFVAAVANVENGRSRQTPSFAACVGPEAGTLSPDHLDGGAIPISPLQRAAGRFSAAPLRNICSRDCCPHLSGTTDRCVVARLVKPVLRADEHGNRPVRGSAASRQPLRGPGARLLRRRHDG